MADQLRESHWLYQDQTVYKIRDLFGEAFTYLNANGNLAIGKDVLREFRKLTDDVVVWERGARAWRLRGPHDQKRRQQE